MKKKNKPQNLLHLIQTNTLIYRVLLLLFVIQVLINLLGVFSPEMSFDALWYHLTFSKLFLLKHQWYFPGGLLYYSAMPRLGETLFIPLLQLLGTTGPKLLQFSSSLWISYLLFRLSKKFYSPNISLLITLLFYNSWLVSWQSSSAYIDLIYSAFQFTALYLLILKPKLPLKISPLILSGIFWGLALGTKWQSLPFFLLASALFNSAILLPALITFSPWMVIAYRFTGNPFYPLGEAFMTQTQVSQVSPLFFHPLQIFSRFLSVPYYLSLPYDDLINPILGLLFLSGLIFVFFKKSHSTLRQLSLYLLGCLFVWQLIPPPSSRYILPLLPLILIISARAFLVKKLGPILISLSFLSLLAITSARLYANTKYLPYLAGKVDQNQFLTSLSYRLPDTFIDSDGWIEQNLSQLQEPVLVSDLHNLYYLPVDYDHVSWANRSYYPYLITKSANPDDINGELVHYNSLGIQVFKLY